MTSEKKITVYLIFSTQSRNFPTFGYNMSRMRRREDESCAPSRRLGTFADHRSGVPSWEYVFHNL